MESGTEGCVREHSIKDSTYMQVTPHVPCDQALAMIEQCADLTQLLHVKVSRGILKETYK
eukprot:1150781-Pelagomonas_calceolata.AAC.4